MEKRGLALVACLARHRRDAERIVQHAVRGRGRHSHSCAVASEHGEGNERPHLSLSRVNERVIE